MFATTCVMWCVNGMVEFAKSACRLSALHSLMFAHICTTHTHNSYTIHINILTTHTHTHYITCTCALTHAHTHACHTHTAYDHPASLFSSHNELNRGISETEDGIKMWHLVGGA